jgi:hypothetical protein
VREYWCRRGPGERERCAGEYETGVRVVGEYAWRITGAGASVRECGATLAGRDVGEHALRKMPHGGGAACNDVGGLGYNADLHSQPVQTVPFLMSCIVTSV